jgi:hypothetical protein
MKRLTARKWRDIRASLTSGTVSPSEMVFRRVLITEIDALRADLAERDARIERLEAALETAIDSAIDLRPRDRLPQVWVCRYCSHRSEFPEVEHAESCLVGRWVALAASSPSPAQDDEIAAHTPRQRPVSCPDGNEECAVYHVAIRCTHDDEPWPCLVRRLSSASAPSLAILEEKEHAVQD